MSNKIDGRGIKKIIIFGFLLHLAFLASVFEIYFQSPIIQGLEAEKNLNNPPAKRVVLLVADGLRAESFFKNGCSRTPFLKKVFKEKGVVGVSHTRVPTESRPGHVALIAGVYEDPSAIARGWQDNPVDFDSVFNRSEKTFSWGSPDIVTIFNRRAADGRVFADSYDPDDEDFSGKTNTVELDLWVFNKVKEFLGEPENFEDLRKDRVILFLHLLGLDTAGHVHKPHSVEFTENLRAVDDGIREITEQIERFYDDDRTSFIFTADHGMTDWGSHGSGMDHETETPFIAWGAGIINPQSPRVPYFHLNQADIAPLISTLIGTAVPVNNYGTLPKIVLNVTERYLAVALQNNALQISRMIQYWIDKFKRAKFQVFAKQFNKLHDYELVRIEKSIADRIEKEEYKEAILLSEMLIQNGLEGVEYYQSYYQSPLLIAITLSMIAWLIFLIQQLLNIANNRYWFSTINAVVGFVATTLILLVVYAQGISFQSGFYFVLPVICWSFIDYTKLGTILTSLSKIKNIIYLFLFFIFIEILVISFFHRSILTVALLVMALIQLYITNSNQKAKGTEPTTYIEWITSSMVLSIFPSLPVIDKDTKNMTILLFAVCVLLIKTVYQTLKTQKIYHRLNLAFTMIFIVNFLMTLKNLNEQNGLSLVNQTISWMVLIVSFMIPLLSELNLQSRMIAIADSLNIPFTLMSLTYEPIFYVALFVNLFCWLRVEHFNYSVKSKKDDEFRGILFSKDVRNIRDANWDDMRRGCFILLYILISFFGTGNIASVSSFDPNWVRCLVSTFSPFLMTTLIVIKLLMPILLVTCILKGIHVVTEISRGKLFILILIICDVVCLNFLFLVRNKGSWLEIGTSISHFVIMEVTVIVLFVIYSVADFLTTRRLNWMNSFDKYAKNSKKSDTFLLPRTYSKKK